MSSVLSSSNFIFQRSHQVSISLRLRCIFLRAYLLYGLSHIYRCHQQRDLDRRQVFESIIYIFTVQYGGQDGTLWHPCLYISWRNISPSTETLKFLWERKELTSLCRLIENFRLDNLYSRPRCHVVSKAFSLSKNTAAIDVLMLKFNATWSVRFIH
jgi:hypothetical protein